jgi:SAM-dependent methyltransferase
MSAGSPPVRSSHTPTRDSTGYGRLVRDGHYAQAPSGLWGKYDHVRRIWEDQVTRFAVRGALDGHVRQIRQAGRGLRVIDLGCGAGEGWDLLCKVPLGTQAGPGRYVLGGDDLASYHGIDLCPDMVAACSASFQDRPQASFAQGDLNELAVHLRRLQPFDLYYNSYGSLSHLADDGLRRLVSAILDHQPGPMTLVIDVHGQFSPEWPGYWGYSRTPSTPRMQPYNMVWMYPEAERAQRLEEQRNYRIRYWRGEELRAFLSDIPGVENRLRKLTLCDRSVLVGRHMDTACFDPQVRPVRREVNTLFEFNTAARLDLLSVPSIPTSGDLAVDAFFRDFTRAWDAVVSWFGDLLGGGRARSPAELCGADGPVPAVLQQGMQSIAETARHLAWFDPGDPEANLLQPQLGLVLRQLEYHMQRGLGCGHGLLAVLQLSSVNGHR